MSSVEEGESEKSNGYNNNNNNDDAVESPYEEVRPTKRKSVNCSKAIPVILCIVGIVVAFVLLIYITVRLDQVDGVSR